MTRPTDPIEDTTLIRNLIAELANLGLESVEGTIPGTLNLKVGMGWIQFLRLEVSGVIQFDELKQPETGSIILPADSVRRSQTAKKVREVARILKIRHRYVNSAK